MKLILENNVFANIHADLGIVFLDASHLEKAQHHALLERAGFKAKQDEQCLLLESGILYCGIDAYTPDALRAAAAGAIKTLSKQSHPRVKLSACGLENIQALVDHRF